ncbi:MAG: carboxymuconolactone decarboxylase family protein [Rhodospirillaceae bacterium]|jgi:alkylhydroperoxidase family enzyme|nr:carboxymuconolactone decarboxylase family protein [Rhodospirillaceae bacterium]MBT3492212.1 carboxymuconolactone decarboxylase family protein [Rhodospirillaceae bacterium]MBT3778537.1 carboxymuconolactone decarboxylase family protein [Rhodospirillaceae bacterium]MBT3977557.1 carboxymuconolactone decarboxylase family protein [Rhodospirillaceae bacterium]MBT4170080.1 carboxymuconolactone decarboxylase family protein [Rhodospirillaceae bacterium]
MARIPYLDVDDLAEDDKELLKRPINLHRALVNSPGAARNFGHVGSYIRFGSKLDPRLRELAILQVGYLARSDYEYSHHIKIGRDFGVSDDDIRDMITETEGRNSGLPALDRAVLRAAREMTEEMKISDITFAKLESHLSSELLVDLTMVIAFYNAVVRMLGTLEIDVEDSYASFLDEFPLPT